jgi:hypothetical protein
MKEGASIVSEESQQVADLLLVIELREGELRRAKAGGNQGEPSSFQPSLWR